MEVENTNISENNDTTTQKNMEELDMGTSASMTGNEERIPKRTDQSQSELLSEQQNQQQNVNSKGLNPEQQLSANAYSLFGSSVAFLKKVKEYWGKNGDPQYYSTNEAKIKDTKIIRIFEFLKVKWKQLKAAISDEEGVSEYTVNYVSEATSRIELILKEVMAIITKTRQMAKGIAIGMSRDNSIGMSRDEEVRARMAIDDTMRMSRDDEVRARMVRDDAMRRSRDADLRARMAKERDVQLQKQGSVPSQSQLPDMNVILQSLCFASPFSNNVSLVHKSVYLNLQQLGALLVFSDFQYQPVSEAILVKVSDEKARKRKLAAKDFPRYKQILMTIPMNVGTILVRINKVLIFNPEQAFNLLSKEYNSMKKAAADNSTGSTSSVDGSGEVIEFITLVPRDQVTNDQAKAATTTSNPTPTEIGNEHGKKNNPPANSTGSSTV